jgi:predicted ArsR family transcriptional regulator
MGHRGRERMVIIKMYNCITYNVASSNPIHDEVCSMQHYVIKFVSDLRQVSGFLLFHPPIKLTATI